MKWFQHQANASDDIKIKRLELEFGNEGYAIFFKILEKVAKEGRKFRIKLQKCPLDLLAKDFHITEELLKKILDKMAELTLISQFWLKKGIIYIPNMRRYADDYTERGRRFYVESKESLTLDKNRIDKNILDKSRGEKIEERGNDDFKKIRGL